MEKATRLRRPRPGKSRTCLAGSPDTQVAEAKRDEHTEPASGGSGQRQCGALHGLTLNSGPPFRVWRPKSGRHQLLPQHPCLPALPSSFLAFVLRAEGTLPDLAVCEPLARAPGSRLALGGGQALASVPSSSRFCEVLSYPGFSPLHRSRAARASCVLTPR